MLEYFKKTHIEMEKAMDGSGSQGLLQLDMRVKDKLFVEFGKPIDLVFKAFSHYGLDSTITESDRQKYE